MGSLLSHESRINRYDESLANAFKSQVSSQEEEEYQEAEVGATKIVVQEMERKNHIKKGD